MLAGVLTLAGCETANGNNNALTKGALGALAGAAAGAIIGNNAGDGDGQAGALIGAVIGGAGGAYAGCREDGGCGAQPQDRNYNHDYSRQQNLPVVQGHTQGQTQDRTLNKRQFFDQNTGRYYYYNPATRQEYYENGEHKSK
ncbi:MAG: hypothetical protein COA91_08615 [Robiginitomaculum sp.]|nr:MAG: hypothetical protein COA91_08615 [Robiginitomaculum sp.]